LAVKIPGAVFATVAPPVATGLDPFLRVTVALPGAVPDGRMKFAWVGATRISPDVRTAPAESVTSMLKPARIVGRGRDVAMAVVLLSCVPNADTAESGATVAEPLAAFTILTLVCACAADQRSSVRSTVRHPMRFHPVATFGPPGVFAKT
jgi:hypothetical protein